MCWLLVLVSRKKKRGLLTVVQWDSENLVDCAGKSVGMVQGDWLCGFLQVICVLVFP